METLKLECASNIICAVLVLKLELKLEASIGARAAELPVCKLTRRVIDIC